MTQGDLSTTVCSRGYTATVRPPVNVTQRIKREQMAAYGLQDQRLGDYELDHLIALELGGAPADVANLWPAPWTGDGNAHQKDAVETHLKREVCRGTVSLTDAQRMIATDGARGGLHRIGGAGQPAERLHGPGTLRDQRY